MKFEDALPQLRIGKSIARAGWKDGAWIEGININNPKTIKLLRCEPAFFSVEGESLTPERIRVVTWDARYYDLLKNDWRVVAKSCQPIKFKPEKSVYT